MDKNSFSFINIIILVVVFLVLPQLMKIFGKHSLSTRIPRRDDARDIGLPSAGETPAGHREEGRWESSWREDEKTVVGNEPIHPKWF